MQVANGSDALARPQNGSHALARPQNGTSFRSSGTGEVPECVDLTVYWGDSILRHERFDPPHAFSIGETYECAMPLSRELLGQEMVRLIRVEGKAPYLELTPRMSGHIWVPRLGTLIITRGDVTLNGNAIDPAIMLEAGSRAVIGIEGSNVRITLQSDFREEFVAGNILLDPRVVAGIAASLALHTAVTGGFAYFNAGLNPEDADSLDRDRLVYMMSMLENSSVREMEREREENHSSDGAPGAEPGAAAKGPAGVMGDRTAKANPNARFAIKGDEKDLRLAREKAREEMLQSGVLGILASMAGTTGPTAAWAQDIASGPDLRMAAGHLFGNEIGGAFGTGLGISGNEDGGGGRHESIGINDFGGLGRGVRGNCVGEACGDGLGGIGKSRGLLPNGHDAKSPRIRPAGNLTVGGHLPAEVIQRIVRSNFGRFRACYEAGLRTNPSLEGRVAVRFVIDRQGAVSLTADSGSTLPDTGVVQCVVRNFGSLTFPAPENGIVTVVYPIQLSPG